MIYALGFTLEKIAAMQEHGIKGCYTFFMYDDFWLTFSFTKSTSKGHGYERIHE